MPNLQREPRKVIQRVLPFILTLAIHGIVFSMALPQQANRLQEMTVIPIEIVTQYSLDELVPAPNEPTPKPLDKPPIIPPRQIAEEKKVALMPPLPKKEIEIKTPIKIKPPQTTKKKERISNTTKNDPQTVLTPTSSFSNGATSADRAQVIVPAATSTASEQPQTAYPIVQSLGVRQEAVMHRQAVPKYQLNKQPGYPLMARRRGLTGTVTLSVFVAVDGRVAELAVDQSSGHDILDRAALKAVAQWIFSPATEDDVPVSMWVSVPITFRLQQT